MRLKLVSTILILCIFSVKLLGQAPDLPQRTAVVQSTQTLSFGDLTILSGSSGGTVTVDYNGSRSATGSVVLLNVGSLVQQAIFEIKICPGRLVTFTYPSTALLTGTNGGNMTLHIGPTNYGVSGAQFISNKGCNDYHYVQVGGTLDVGSLSANPAGTYSGTFNLTFVQQ